MKTLTFFISILSIFSSAALLASSNAHQQIEGSCEAETSTSWRMPRLPYLDVEQNAYVEAEIQRAPAEFIDAYYALVSKHIFSLHLNQGKNRTSFIVDDMKSLSYMNINEKDPLTIRLFLHCVGLSEQQLNRHGEMIKPLGAPKFRRLMRAIGSFPLTEQASAVDHAEQLFAISGKNDDISKALVSLSRITIDRRDSIVSATMDLAPLTPSTSDILKALASFSLEDLPGVIGCAKEISEAYEGCMQLGSNAYSLEWIHSLSHARRETLCETLRPFMDFPGMDLSSCDIDALYKERNAVLNAITQLSEQDYSALLENTDRIRAIADAGSPTEKYADIEGYGKLLHYVGGIPEELRPILFEDISTLIQGTVWGKVNIYGGFNGILAMLIRDTSVARHRNPDHFLEYTFEIMGMTNNPLILMRSHLLNSLAHLFRLDDLELGAAVRRITQILPYLVTDDAWSSGPIKSAIKIHKHFEDLDQLIPFLELPLSNRQRDYLVDALLELLTPQHGREGLFMHIRQIDRDEFIEQALTLCRLPLDYPRDRLIKLFAGAPAENRQNVLDQVLNLKEGDDNRVNIERIFWQSRLERFWLDGNGNEALGLDVHHGGRDQKVTHALNALVSAQGHMKTSELESFIESCRQYIANGDFTDMQKQRALIALEGERADGGWGPLLSQSTSPAFANLDGIGLAGRIWCFADTFIDPLVPNDAENARRSFVMALVDSAYVDGWMVCNLGKIQRIVCGVLQGRLPDIAVDAEAEIVIAGASNQADASTLDQQDTTENALTQAGQQLATLYLQTLNGAELPSNEPGMCAAAAAWLREQGIECDDVAKQAFFDDVKTFFRYSG